MTSESFGIIPIRFENGIPFFFLVHHRTGFTGFPKGHAEPNEGPFQAAVRELKEETGLEVEKLLFDMPLVEHYTYLQGGAEIEKSVTYYVASIKEHDARIDPKEIVEGFWANYSEAIHKITFKESIELCRQVNRLLRSLGEK
ncbi:MAG: hypothetical protein A3F09_03860 [Chlamydiae bacterium RIFCSPHIGHO2_12_FULL_49_11]|nr:MAG: hypothetical protein A3F09_03860 [Chlamydiae bacterium RIFCSPHIGHO2_12_FULL_49_11]